MTNSNKIEKVDLQQYGYIQAGQSQGNPLNFRAALESIFQGNLIDESIDEVSSEEERQNLQSEIESFKRQIEQHVLTKSNLQDEINSNNENIRILNEEISNIRQGLPVNSRLHESFSSMKFFLNLFFLIPLSVYLFLFYVATIFKVFYFSPEQIADQSNGTISALPAPGELSEALSYNYLLLFAPFLFFAFGYAIHVLLEQKSKLKYIYIALVISITFILDFLMAYKIHDNTSKAEEMISDTIPIPLFEDANFYIILFMGFVVYIIWSILLNAVINEWRKRNVIEVRLSKIDSLSKDNLNLKLSINEIDGSILKKESEIKSLEEIINGRKLPINKLLFCLSELQLGWLNYLSGAQSFHDRISECKSVFQNFLTDNQLDI